MSSTIAEAEKIGAIVPQWSKLVDDLFQEITGWSKKNGWQVTYSDTDALDYSTSTSPMPVLLLMVPEAPEGQIILEPQSLNGGGKGRVKMYASESLYRVRLLPSTNNEWTILTDSGISLHDPWGKKPSRPLCLIC